MTTFRLAFIHCLNKNTKFEILLMVRQGPLAKLSYLYQLGRSERMTINNGKAQPFSFNEPHCDSALYLRVARSTSARAAQRVFLGVVVKSWKSLPALEPRPFIPYQ
jgi:hypothetical protein